MGCSKTYQTAREMKLRKTLKYRLYRHKRNKYLHNRIDIAGIIWNHMIALQRRSYRLSGRYIGQSEMQRHLLKLRKTARFGYWQQVGSQAVQELAERQHKAMQQLWGRKVSDLGFATFLSIQEQVCKKMGKGFQKVGRWQPTTRACCRCRTLHELPLSQRTFHCRQCGLVIARDWNAAINICAEGASFAGFGKSAKV